MRDTITVYEKCDHGRLEKHNDPAWPILNDETGEWNPMCPGGREITLTKGLAPDTCPRLEASYHDGRHMVRFSDRWTACERCGGRGYVWPARLVAPIAAELATMERVPESWRLDKARRVLDVLWEVGNEV